MFLKQASEVIIGDYAFPIRNDWRVYLKVNEILTNKDIFEMDKITAICKLVYEDDILPSVLAVESYLRLFTDGKGGSEPVFDLQQDKDLIYAGFYQTYGIDLNTVGEMSVEKFLALLKGLPADTKFAEVIKIRTMPIPTPTKYNTDERQAIIKAKASVALRGSDNVGAGLRSLAEMMRVWANGR